MSAANISLETVSLGRVNIRIEVVNRDDVYRARWMCSFCGKRWGSKASHSDAATARSQAKVAADAHAAFHAPKADF